MEVKINEKSIKKWNQDGKASWHRFLMDFGGFGEPSWGQVGRENRAKTGQDKGREGKRREGKGKDEEGKGLEGKGVEKCGLGDFPLGGEGFARLLGGDLPIEKYSPSSSVSWKRKSINKVLGPSWAVLRASWDRLRASLSLFGRSWGLLGRSWGRLGTLGRPTFPPTLPRTFPPTFPPTFPRTFYWQLEPQLGSQNDAKMAKKSN